MIHHALPGGIYVVDVEYQKQGIACAYLVEQAGKLAIVETGTTIGVARILSAIVEIGYGIEDVDWIIPTHIHLDHAGGAGALMAKCPNARLVIHPRGARHMIDPNVLIQATIEVYGEDKFRQYYGDIIPIEASRVIEAPDEFELDFEGRVFPIIRYTPVTVCIIFVCMM